MGKHRFEVATTGADEALEGLSSDPFYGGAGTPVSTGLRIPSLVNDASNRYLMLLATRVINNTRTRILGIRQYLEIGMDLGPQLGISTERPVSMQVVTPTFRFSDGANVSWHLVLEPMPRRTRKAPLTDTQSFKFMVGDGPALVYQTFSASHTDANGAPLNYAVDLTSYSPPKVPNDWKSIAGLRSLRDIRYPWDSNHAWNSINEVVGGGNWRVSLYASVLQTNPATRPGIVFGTGIATNGTAVGGPPEEDFIYKYTFTAVEQPTAGPQFWLAAGSIVFEDEVDGGDLKMRLPGGE